jgi:hypothetical protein
MKLITIFFAVLYTTNSIFIISSQAAQHSLQPEFTCLTNRKNAQEAELSPDTSFMTIANLTVVLAHILQEKNTENHWLFESKNYPNLKQLRIQRTNPTNRETTLATYTMAIPADGKSHTDTSIWGFFPFRTTSTDIGLTPHTATQLSELFVKHHTRTSSTLMPIVHCIISGKLTYYNPQLSATSTSLPADDNRYTVHAPTVKKDYREEL